MRILMCNKYFRTEGASTKYFFALSEAFKAAGHDVIHFSMRDGRNQPSPFEKYFVEPIDFNRAATPLHYAKEFAHAIYSVTAKSQISRLLDEHRPDVAMLFNIYHHLSPSILTAIRERSIESVLLLEDFFLVCPSYRFYANGGICEKCKGGRYYNAILQRCFHASLGRSVAASAVAYVHEVFGLYDGIDRFIAPSDFMRAKCIEHGIDGARISVVPHALALPAWVDGADGDYFLYAGVVEPWKGIDTLIRAMAATPTARLVVLGQGKGRPGAEQLATELGARNVQFLGWVPQEEFESLMRHARAVIVPSEWYEVFGTVIWEAFSFGRPVIGARAGAIPELVQDGVTGRLFEPGNVGQLAEILHWMNEDPDQRRRMSRHARSRVETDLTIDRNCARTLRVLRGNAKPGRA